MDLGSRKSICVFFLCAAFASTVRPQTGVDSRTVVQADTTRVFATVHTVDNMIINYQGFLTNAAGDAVTGTVSAQISIWDDAVAGAKLWEEQQSLSVRLGYFTAEVGATTSFPAGLFNGSGRYIQISINGQPLLPRKKVAGVPYALYAVNAGTLAGNTADQFITQSGAEKVFVTRGLGNSINSNMIMDNEIISQDIKDGSILIGDLAFPVSNISQISPGTGLTGGGTYGNVYLSLAPAYQVGSAYDDRFVNVNEPNSVMGYMIADNEITGLEIKNGTIKPEDLSFSAGGISAVYTSNGIIGGGETGAVSVQLDAEHYSGAAYDTRFVSHGQPSSITSTMITNGTIREEDLSFPLGDVTAVIAQGGVVGGGSSGDLLIKLEPEYATGDAYNIKFVNENQSSSVNSEMIVDNSIGSLDIANNALMGDDLSSPFTMERSEPGDAVMTIRNFAYEEASRALEVHGYYGLKGYGTHTGVYGEGNNYGVYAKATNPAGYSLYVQGRAYCTSGSWGDLAEFVFSDELLHKGDVVVIDPAGQNKVKRCDQAGDVRVAGIVSSDPTIVVGASAQQQRTYPLALAGIVPCKVIAIEPIVAGDLLTTSSHQGYAMKAVNAGVGTIVGKALQSLESGSGMINVLVMSR